MSYGEDLLDTLVDADGILAVVVIATSVSCPAPPLARVTLQKMDCHSASCPQAPDLFNKIYIAYRHAVIVNIDFYSEDFAI